MRPIPEKTAKLFATAWLQGLRGRELLLASGIVDKNATRATNKFINHPQVIEEIERIEKQAKVLRDVDIATLMGHLAKICYFDSHELWSLANNPNQEWSGSARAAISSIKVTRSYRNGIEKDECLMDVTTEVKTKDSLRAAKMIADHLGAFKDLPTLLSGLKSYGIEMKRVNGKFEVLVDDSDQIAA